jgi:hypothetical protein
MLLPKWSAAKVALKAVLPVMGEGVSAPHAAWQHTYATTDQPQALFRDQHPLAPWCRCNNPSTQPSSRPTVLPYYGYRYTTDKRNSQPTPLRTIRCT